MADAEVIPLGTRGRPGRGSGNAKPSSAARTLAPAAARRKAVPPPRTPPDAPADPPRSVPPVAPRLARDEPVAVEPTPPPHDEPTAATAAPAADESDPPRARVRDREPAGGIPVGGVGGSADLRRPGGVRRPLGAAAPPSCWPSCGGG